ncbi:hypothetical protein OIU34_35145 [Pararhizobium sp. BT-229]|uniref:hypothetical protein n=1 Tax=Pararhizobium sp. BT-229 TaxID=2986923 RepID=UPI0021F74FDF|nr:hypothetical protein [Pararhizobium sp. BT-229]MCV9967070.1 hypothetical protein [Pararhizobium sp. BT-229]
MTIEAAKHRVSHPDRDLACQETVEGAMQDIIADATTKGWGTMETINAMEEVLRNLRLAYAEDLDLTKDKANINASSEPDPSNDWPAAEP